MNFEKGTKINQQFEYILERKNRLHDEIVFCDGIGSSGKGMLSHLIGTFERVEKQQNHICVDYISTLVWLDKISIDAAKTYLLSEIDMQLYHAYIGRDMNLRFKDSTSVFQNSKIIKNLLRLFLPAGRNAIRRIERQRPILNEAPHDAMRNADFFFDCFYNLKIIYIVRDPIDLINDWIRRGFGQRIGVDKREFQLNVSQGKTTKPLYMMDSQHDYDSLSEIQRIILMIKFCYKYNLEGFNKLSKVNKEKVLFIAFDDLCSKPQELINKMSSFLSTKYTRSTKRVLRKEGLPRRLKERDSISRFIQLHNLDQEFANKLISIYDDHANFLNYVKAN